MLFVVHNHAKFCEGPLVVLPIAAFWILEINSRSGKCTRVVDRSGASEINRVVAIASGQFGKRTNATNDCTAELLSLLLVSNAGNRITEFERTEPPPPRYFVAYG